MKKTISIILALSMAVTMLAGCGSTASSSSAPAATEAPAVTAAPAATEAPAAEAGMTGAISVISREDGSGTRGAFVELVGVEQKDADGKKVDHTTETAEITNSTAVMMTTVAGNKASIGYISLGSLNDSVKALDVDGAAATVDNIKSGSYAIARPFNIATKGDVSEVAQDFIDYIMSEEGQKIVEDNHYISQGNTGAFAGGKVSGTIVVAGSSSVTPVMEKLKEAYETVNADVTIDIQQSDSTSGMTATIDGLCDIGMASRELKSSETDAGLAATVIAMDGIAVIVNNENPTAGLTNEQICGIFTGEITDWSELG